MVVFEFDLVDRDLFGCDVDIAKFFVENDIYESLTMRNCLGCILL